MPQEVIDEAFEAFDAFFALSLEETKATSTAQGGCEGMVTSA